MEPVATTVAKQAWPWTATFAVIAGVSLDQWVAISTLLYTVIQIALSLRKWFKDK